MTEAEEFLRSLRPPGSPNYAPPAWRHDLDPDAMTDEERRAKRRYDAFFVFETMPAPREEPDDVADPVVR